MPLGNDTTLFVEIFKVLNFVNLTTISTSSNLFLSMNRTSMLMRCSRHEGSFSKWFRHMYNLESFFSEEKDEGRSLRRLPFIWEKKKISFFSARKKEATRVGEERRNWRDDWTNIWTKNFAKKTREKFTPPNLILLTLPTVPIPTEPT